MDRFASILSKLIARIAYGYVHNVTEIHNIKSVRQHTTF
jgi:hypothetical protein